MSLHGHSSMPTLSHMTDLDDSDDAAPETPAEIAADWLVRQQTRPLTAAEAAELESWLQASPEHGREYEAVQRMWGVYAAVPKSGISPLPLMGEGTEQVPRLKPAALNAAGPSPPAPLPQAGERSHRRAMARRTRRQRLRRPAVIAAALLACLLGAASFDDLSLRLHADAVTSTGEIATLTLPDGSSMTLNTRSAVKMDFTPERRVMHLLAGEADFRVAADAARPFIVLADGGSARALGTEFIVRRNATGATVTVIEHTVAVNHAGAGNMPAEVILQPGEQLQYTSAGLGSAQTTDVETAAAWRNGWLSFENRPLGEVIAELSRYHRGWIGVTDPALKQLRVTCVIPANDPMALFDNLEQSLGLRTTRLTDYLVLIDRG